MKGIFFIFIFAGFMLISGILTQKAYAYLDPGMGSYLFQIIIAFLVGGLYIVKLFWGRICNFFKNFLAKKGKKD